MNNNSFFSMRLIGCWPFQWKSPSNELSNSAAVTTTTRTTEERRHHRHLPPGIKYMNTSEGVIAMERKANVALEVPQVHLISVPHEVLAAPSQFELTFSKINAWPVDIYARVLPSHLSTESEAQIFVNRLLQSESYFSALSLPITSASSTDEDSDDRSFGSSGPNLFNKRAHSQGLDVEKLYFEVHSRNDHYLLVGINPTGVSTFSKSKLVYKSFPLQIDIQPVLLGVPWPFFKLAALIISVVIAYFVLLRRYQLRLFGIK